MDSIETKSGVVRRVFYAAPDGSFMAGVLEEQNGAEVRFSGKLAASAGDHVEVTGRWVMNPKFGRQFEVETGVAKMNESPEALAHLLAKDARFEGLGPVRARKVVDAALHLSANGEISSALIEYPEEIAKRSGVKVSIVRKAAAVWAEEKEHFDAIAVLVDQGWTGGQADRILREFGEGAPALIARDPYMIIGKLARFGFRTVDAVALKMGISPMAQTRIFAGLAYCLERIADSGSTYMLREGLLHSAIEELRPNTLDAENEIMRAIEELIERGEVFCGESLGGREMIADIHIARVECSVFSRLQAGLEREVEPLSEDGEAARESLPTLNEGQRLAVRGCSGTRFAVISGGAGVGKTYTMRTICALAQDNGLRVGLCAPTGKAARRLSDATQREAKTIHRLLEPTFDERTGGFRFTRDKSNPLELDLVVVDEVSMVDVHLMHSLLLALPDRCRMLLVGDHHQIPSVGAGAILRDLLTVRDRYPNAIHVLSEIVRQAGRLAVNTNAILDGVVPFETSPEWSIVRTEKGQEITAAAHVATIFEYLVTASEPMDPFGRQLDPLWDVQILAPMRKGPLGTHALNVSIQAIRQRLLGNAPPPPVVDGNAPKPIVGDRVIWTKNDAVLNLFNGTQAVLREMRKGGAVLIETDDGREVVIEAGKRQHLDVAWAMTVHKSQGSEWPAVILIGSSSHWIMHDRNLLYTGASRASKSLTLVGDAMGLKHFASERKSAERKTFGVNWLHGWRPVDGVIAPV